MFRPDETGGLGLTDTTAEHVMQAVGLALPRREPYLRRLKRVKYLQMSNYQLFKKIQLASDHVRTPLKSELNFYKPLIFNDLTKFDSLQTLSVYFSPDSQLSFL